MENERDLKKEEVKKKDLKKKEERPFTVRDKLKLEIAEELGFMDKINNTGWKSLTARESGRLGGILAKREKDLKEQAKHAELTFEPDKTAVAVSPNE
mgnify:CR=1 FL=1